ncbi:hypothetical protein WFC_00110 [Escherichia phage vB_EcoM_WFC]|uniref:Uncharacterized protein n=2 Tax=Wifcevirus TaxID=2733141 RepID=A0A482MWB2_9CAUD|nr:hypothetical protein HOU28_gp01 [Escherichia phage FEC19]YP_009823557.1 hypothetical protein HOV52_gp004 [Escherichia phage vB_EcoM_WFC]YP_009823663.1 hypothetical protein HOV52_gp110 [Escherichia phage vB_EcoM_WFC]AYD85430.1 hypothetical protein [Escherichia phage FEC19]QBQ77396.1 hypothetical protein WFC_00004 [Escherichia phage vB_EcoM_WFC]QBQ77502.1 hypothetical protein WFC_00110 [Escherichia phage vB_EcoM_WFC]
MVSLNRFSTSGDVIATKTADLVAFYNANSGSKPIKKFADRRTAETRVIALIESLNALDEPSNESPIPDAKSREEVSSDVKTHKARAVVKKAEPTQEELDAMTDEEYEAFVKSGLNDSANCVVQNGTPSHRRSNSEGIAKSWDNKEVAQKRLTRNGVMVEGVGEFKSVRVAFAALGLPDSKHIRFRMKLKEAGRLNFEFGNKSYTFQII